MPKSEFWLFCTAAVLSAGDTMDKVSTIHQAEKLLEAEELTLPDPAEVKKAMSQMEELLQVVEPKSARKSKK